MEVGDGAGRVPHLKLREYRAEDFDRLTAMVRGVVEVSSLLHRPFVDHYYLGGDRCRLWIAEEDDARIVATLGSERMRFVHALGESTFGFGSNWLASQRGQGQGGAVYDRWAADAPTMIAFGGSADAHAVLQRRGWRYFEGVKIGFFNRPKERYPSDGPLRGAAKWAVNRFRRRLRADASLATEVDGYDEGLLPRTSPFSLRFAPDVGHLAWRYGLGLEFVTYRAFRLERTRGYVILQERDDRVLVSQCDGEDPVRLAEGVLAALAQLLSRRRYAMLACSHPAMLEVYRRHGFDLRTTRALLLHGGPAATLPDDTGGWLVNFDWGDNGLRAPFPSARSPSARSPAAGAR